MRRMCRLLVVLGVMLALLLSAACGGDEPATEEMEKDAEAKTEVMEAPAMASRWIPYVNEDTSFALAATMCRATVR